MASGRTHDTHGLLAGALLALPGLYFRVPEAVVVASGVVVGTLWLSPDLDLENTRPYKRWGPLRFLWWPYAKMHKHRGLSHHWLFGSLGRLAYLGLLTAPLWVFLEPTQLSWLGWFVLGVFISNWLHLLGDL